MIERGRQDVLAGVLLHVIEPACSVDGALHVRAGRDYAIENVQDLVALIHNVDDASLAERACVERLTARGRIEGGTIQDRRRLAIQIAHVHNACVELQHAGVGVIEALGHD